MRKPKIRETNNNSMDDDTIMIVTVRTEPRIDDPREMETILLFSLRGLFGELEHYSWRIKSITKKQQQPNDDSNNNNNKTIPSEIIIECPYECVGAVRSALTLPTPPPYLSSTNYCFDVIDIQPKGER